MKTRCFRSPFIDTVDASVSYFHTTVDFPSWTSPARLLAITKIRINLTIGPPGITDSGRVTRRCRQGPLLEATQMRIPLESAPSAPFSRCRIDPAPLCAADHAGARDFPHASMRPIRTTSFPAHRVNADEFQRCRWHSDDGGLRCLLCAGHTLAQLKFIVDNVVVEERSDYLVLAFNDDAKPIGKRRLLPVELLSVRVQICDWVLAVLVRERS